MLGVSRNKPDGEAPGGPVAENPLANAGDKGSIPGLGRFPHAKEQLSLCATAAEPTSSKCP